ncbi:phage portal protein [Tardibacter chloracetimidivorans]|uniref:Phage portal protein n=1 Tax=Tardibacter chloracetimidivorans TaxID=1921510 RepID=A0A1L3ZRM5_9SPHN|nr:phage portal protein [Tardibacter chloracetimidivorans]
MTRPRFRSSIPPQRRSFQAGITDRLTSSWTSSDMTVNQSLIGKLKPMRARSRDFARNSEYGRKFFSLIQTNMVGHAGFSLKFDCRRPDGTVDKVDSARVLEAFKRWAKRGQCEVTGKLSWVQIQKLIATMTARDGEMLIQFVEGPTRGIHRFQLKLIPGHLLDEDLHRELPGGGVIRMGVEFDPDMKPVAYHIKDGGPRSDIDGPTAAQKHIRVPAREILHLFVPEELNQWRGVPWAFAGLRGARHLDQFEESALVAANAGASKMGFFFKKEMDGMPSNPADLADEASGDEQPEFLSDFEPGTFGVLPDGYDMKAFDPAYPNDVFDPFTKAVARKMATGLLTSYHSLTGDLTQVNFSSIRSGTLDDREHWKLLQGWEVGDALEPIVEAWLARALLYDTDLRQLPFTKFDKFNAPVFQGRRWDWVDPKADMAAEKEAVALKIKSRAQVIRERGGDPEQVWTEIEAEEQRLGPVAQPPPQPGQQPSAADDDDDDDEAA